VATLPAMATRADGEPTSPPTATPVEAAPNVAAFDTPGTAATVVPVPAVVGLWAPPARTKATGCTSQGGLPDPACTPGALDPRVTPATAGRTICTSGYTATVRPPVSVTERIKRSQMAAYGLAYLRPADYELDHLVALELGGAPQDVANLWPEPWTGEASAHQKDAVETYLRREVCSGAMSLADAQRQIATDWLAVYRGKGLQPVP